MVVVVMTNAMKSRVAVLGCSWINEGYEYYSIIGKSKLFDNIKQITGKLLNNKVRNRQPIIPSDFVLVYIAIPEDHVDIRKSYDDLSPEVNGGLTFADDNVFGWDYGHANNSGTPEEDIQNAFVDRTNVSTEQKNKYRILQIIRSMGYR